MPWEHCGQAILDDKRCPTCGCSKPAWTLRLERTREFVISQGSDLNEAAQAGVLQDAAADGTPFCEECAKAEAQAAGPQGAGEDADDERPQPVPASQGQQAATLKDAAEDGAPFCEECAQAEAEGGGA